MLTSIALRASRALLRAQCTAETLPAAAGLCTRLCRISNSSNMFGHSTNCGGASTLTTVSGSQQLTDWSGFISTTADVRIVNSVARLKEIIAEAHHNNVALKVIGSLHSASDIWVPGKSAAGAAGLPSIVVDVGNLDNITIDDTSKTAWVGAGTKLCKLIGELEGKGLGIDSVGGATHQTIAGVVSTGTLPASAKYNMGFVTALRVLKWDEANQQVVSDTIDCTSDNYILSLGMLYVITEVQVKLLKAQRFDAFERIVSYAEAQRDYKCWNQEFAFWRINWVASHKEGLLWAAKPSNDDSGKSKKYSDNLVSILRNVIAHIHKFTGGIGPASVNPQTHIQYLLKVLWCLIICWQKLEGCLGRLKYHGSFGEIIPRDQNVNIRVTMAEWFFPEKQIHLVAGLVLAHFLQYGVGCVPFEFEPVKSNNVLLSPACRLSPDEDVLYKVNFMYEQTHNITDVNCSLKELWDEMLDNGVKLRWHWAKLHYADRALIEKVYGEQVVQQFVSQSMPALRNAYFWRHFKHL